MIDSKNGIILAVLKFQECIRFYKEKIGLTVLLEKPGIVRFQFGTMYLQLEDSEKLDMHPTQNVILREKVSSISAKQEELLEKDTRLEIYDLEWGKIGFVFDPHGNKVEYIREK